MNLTPTLSNLPAPLKGLLVIGGGGGFLWGVFSLLGLRGLAIVLTGLGLVGLTLLGYLLLLKRHRKRRAERLGQGIRKGLAGTPQGGTQAEVAARMDDLRRRFEQGLKTFQAAGKDLYALPWFILVGEPGGGKTEAIRKSNIGFPPGLHDELQGAGGTINMNWWFTNAAVILDTAGRLMFDDVDTAQSTEWKEFLRLLREVRPNCPINGMMLVISAESLIRDSAEDIEKKGAKIARQFDTLQRTLDIRFPATVLITKCDLINGFREYFEDLRDPQLQHQMLGWSNPEPIDRPFQPDLVSGHLESVRQRLLDHRLLLLNRAGTSREDAARPFDASDALYDFPHSFARVLPRLKRYLQIVFAAGEWTSKPLFLRGIYFTSSMRDGQALDAELAEALGLPVEALPEGKVWEKDRAYFLRDVWKEKVFKEKGLVTRASNTQRLLWRRKALLLGAGFCSVALLFLLTWLGGGSFRQNVGLERDYWAAAADGGGWQSDAAEGEFWFPLVFTDADGRNVYGGATPVAVGQQTLRAADFHAELSARVERPLHIPLVFRASEQMASMVRDEGSLRAQRSAARHILFEAGVLRPLLRAVRRNMSRETARTWSADARAALEQLIRLEAHATAPGRVADTRADRAEPLPLLDLDALFRYALGAASDGYRSYCEQDRAPLTRVMNHVYGKREERFQGLSAGDRLTDNAAIHAGLTAFAQQALRLEKIAALQNQVRLLREWAARLKAVRAAAEKNALEEEARFLARFDAELNAVTQYRLFRQSQQAWNREYAALRESAKRFQDEIRALETLRQAIPLLQTSENEHGYEQTLLRAATAAEEALATLRMPNVKESVSARIGRSMGQESAATLTEEVARELENAVAELHAWRESQRKVADEFASAAALYATTQDAGRKLEKRFGIYEKGHAHLNMEDPVPAAGDLATALARLKESTQQTQISLHPLSADDDPRSRAAAKLTRQACALAAQGRAYRMADAVLRSFPDSVAALSAHIADRATRLAAPRRTTVSFTAGDPEAYDTRYHPVAALQALETWQAAEPQLVQTDAPWLDPASLQPQIQAARKHHKEYALLFSDYWNTRLIKDLTIRPMKWEAFHKALAQQPVAAIQRGLEEFGQTAQSVANVEARIEHDLPAPQKRRIRSGLEAGLLRLQNRTFQSAGHTMIENWSRLPSAALAARDLVLPLTPAQFSARYLAIHGEAPADYVSRYWNDLAHALVRALTVQAQEEAREALRNFDRHLKFPLNPLRAGAPDLTAEEVAAAAATLGRIRPVSGAGGATLGGGAATGLPALDLHLRQLVGLGLPETQGLWLNRIQSVLNGLPAAAGQRYSCRIRLLGEAEQQRLFKADQGDILQDGIFSIWRVLALEQGQAPAARLRTLHHESPLLATAPYPGPLLRLAFYRYPGDTEADWSLSFAGPWAPLRILHAGNARRDATDPRKWNVRIDSPARQGGKRRSAWIQLEFDHVLPEIKDWPVYRQTP
jgi:hypothetical protein